jgi:hemin uptake protein HemP
MGMSSDHRDKPSQSSAGPEPQRIDVECLLAGRREIRLLYAGQEYRLLLTRNSKLILTK